jgi:hypothetical protein
VAGKNKIINGDFGVWQRGTSFSSPTVNQYLADRWYFGGGSNFTGTINAQTFTPGSAPVAGYEGTTYWRFNGSATLPALITRLEDVRLFAGQTATLSFWARASSNVSMNATSVDLYQYFGSGGSSGVDNSGYVIPFTIGSNWQRFTVTTPVASINGKTIGSGNYLSVILQFPTISSQTLDIWGVQLEAGSVATPFTTASGTVQGELALCQRYYQNVMPSGGFMPFGYIGAYNTSYAQQIFYPVVMRATPTLSYLDNANNSNKISTYASSGGRTDNLSPGFNFATSSGFEFQVGGNYTILALNSLTANAEL